MVLASVALGTSPGAVTVDPSAGRAFVVNRFQGTVSLIDDRTGAVLQTIEDLGFCEKGKGGAFVADGSLQAPHGRLPFNTDGGGLCNNHPANRGSMTKIIEAVRQLRGEAHPAVQVKNCDLALAQGMGFLLATRHGSATLIMERE